MEKEHIFLVVPTTGNTMSSGSSYMLMNAQKRNADPECKYRFSTSTLDGRTPVEYMRNCLVHEFLKTDATRVWMIDNDMHPSTNAFDLLETEGDIVAGFFYMFTHKSQDKPSTLQVCAFKRDENGKHIPISWDPENGHVVDVDSVGTGSCIMSRKLFEDERMLLDDSFVTLDGKEQKLHRDYPNVPKCFFRRHYAPNGQIIRGADIDFCERAKGLGYSVRVDMAVPFSQVNRVSLNEMADLITSGRVTCASEDRALMDSDILAVHDAWGNKDWAAPLDYLKAMVKMARNSDGAIIECGSGATTMLLQQICVERPDLEVVTLEDNKEWYEKTLKHMDPTITNHKIYHAPIKDSWYNLDGVDLPKEIGMVVVDGPPSSVGRYEAMPALRSRCKPGYAFLVDDAERDKLMLGRWQNEFGVRVRMSNQGRGIAVVSGDGISS